MATLAELEAALKKAHAAGNTEHARAFANAIRQMRATQTDNGVRMSPQEWADTENLPIPGTEWYTPEQPARFKSPIPGGDFMNETARTFAENVPIVGPLVDRGAQAAGAQIASAITGGGPEQAQATRDMLRERDASEQPVANAVGTVAGAVGPLMAAGTTKVGQQALGMAGPLWQRIMAGAASGGVISAGDAAARGESTNSQVLGQFGLGAGLGAAFPVVERGLSAVARALMASDADRAAATIASGLERDKVDPRVVDALLKQTGPDAMLIDAGTNVSRQGAAVASLPGEGQTLVRDALVQRNLGTNARIQGDVDAALGPSPTPSYVQRTIREGQQSLQPAYRQVLQGAAPVDTAPVAQTLDDIIRDRVGPSQRTAQQLRNWLDEADAPGTLSQDPARLLSVRNAIDGLFEGEANPQVIAVLSEARRSVDDILANAVPGIKQVDAQFEELARQSTGLREGANVLDSGKTAIRPTELQDMVNQGVQPQGLFVGPSGETFRVSQGARAEIDRIVGTTTNNLNAMKTALKGDGSWNRDRLVTLFGQDKADNLLNILEREATYQRTYNMVLSNSETAARQAAQKDVAPLQFGERPSGVVDMLMRVPQAGANAAARSRSESVNKLIAEALMSQPSPELVDRLIAARAANIGKIGSAPVPLLVNQ